MLFISNPPIQLEIQEDRKVIILTNTKIIFSHLDFIQQYLAMPLITKKPIKMYYEESVMQTLILSDTTIELYYCDWKTQIKLIKVIILNNEYVESICFEKDSGWHIFGSILQYEPAKISFHKPNVEKKENILSQCFIEKNKYLLTQNKLQKSECSQNFKQVWWKDRMMVLKNNNYKIEMEASQTLDKKKDIICINHNYILIVSRYEVLSTIVEPNIVFFKNNLLISNFQKGKMTTVQKFQNNSFAEIGTIAKQDGQLYGAFLYEDDLVMLHYDDKQIKMHSLPLFSPKQQSGQNVSKKHRRKRIFQSISRIMEQSHEEGSQFLQRDDKNNQSSKVFTVNINQKDRQFVRTSRPLVRDITADDEAFRDDSLAQGDSQVLSRSGIDEGQSHQKQAFPQNSGIQQNKINIESMSNLKSKRSLEDRNFDFKTNVKPTDLFHSENIKNRSKNYSYEMTNEILEGEQDDSFQNRVNNKNVSRISGEAHNTSNTSSNYGGLQTPMFRDDTQFNSNNAWPSHDQFNMGNKNLINEQNEQQMEQSLCINDNEKSFLKFVPDQISLKVQKFKPDHGMLTAQMYNKIEKATYCSLISKVISVEPDRFQQFMELFLPEVLNETEAPLFFETNIRTFNPQFTQDKIRKLFKTIIDKQQLKTKMTSALQQFRLSEVPKQILCFPQDFLKIVSILYKDIYIEDLLKPSESTIEYLLESYFSIKTFPEQIVTIEDEQIDITHPRNMLNVLLYLNEYLCIKIQTIIKVYCSKLLTEDQLQILRKISLKQNIFEICEVPKTVLDEIIIQRFNQLLNESIQNVDYLWNIIEFLNPELAKEYRIRLAIITQFNKCNLIFDLASFIKIKSYDVNIYTFLQKIINENSCRNLINFKLQGAYRSIYWLQENQKITYATNQYIELTKILAQKFSQRKLFYYALKAIQTVLPSIKPSFIAKLLYTNLKSRYVYRLADFEHDHIDNLKTLFPELASSPDIDVSKLGQDQIKIPQTSKCMSCSWSKFNSIFQRNLQGSIQLKILTFSAINITHQLFLSLEQNQKRKFQNFLTQISTYLTCQIQTINQADQSINPKGLTSIRFAATAKPQLQSQYATSTLNRQDVLLLHEDHEHKKKNVYKSMTLIDHYNDVNTKLFRRNSDENRDNKILSQNEDLMRVKLLVNKNEIIEELCEIYEKKKQGVFVESLYLVDLDKIGLHHLDIFKAIVNKQLQFPLSRILPFEIFLSQDPKQAFEVAHKKIKSQLSVKNFWVIYLICELMFKTGDQVIKLLIQKCVIYFRNDTYSEIIQKTIAKLNVLLDQQFISKMVQECKDYNLSSIQTVLINVQKSSITATS